MQAAETEPAAEDCTIHLIDIKDRSIWNLFPWPFTWSHAETEQVLTFVWLEGHSCRYP